MIGILRKNESIMLWPAEVQSLIQDLVSLEKPFQERETLGSLMR